MAVNKPKRESSPGTPGASTPTLMSSLQTCDRTSAAVTSSEKQCPLPCLPRAHGHHALGPPRPDVGFPTDCSEMPVGVHRELSSDVWPWRQRGPRRRAARPHSRCPPAVAELPRPSPPWLWLMSHSGSQRSGQQGSALHSPGHRERPNDRLWTDSQVGGTHGARCVGKGSETPGPRAPVRWHLHVLATPEASRPPPACGPLGFHRGFVR